MPYTYFPVRYAITANPDSYNVVLMVDQMEKHFIQIEDFEMGSFLEKASSNFPLFIIEETPITLGSDVDFVPGAKQLTAMLERHLIKLKANYYKAPYARVPLHYILQYRRRGIASNFHKALWLCTFNVSFENLSNTNVTTDS